MDKLLNKQDIIQFINQEKKNLIYPIFTKVLNYLVRFFISHCMIFTQKLKNWILILTI